MDQQTFETCTVHFSMTGRTGTEQVFNTSVRKNVTPAEYLILEDMHGKHNVKFIEQTDPAGEFAGYVQKGKTQVKRYRPRSHDEEVHRLRSWYGERAFQSVFPTKNPHLPYTFSEARIHTSVPDNVRSISEGKTAEAQSEQLASALERGAEETGDSKKSDDDKKTKTKDK